MAFTIHLEQFVIAYRIEVGLLVGVAMMLPLLPRRVSSREGLSKAIGAKKTPDIFVLLSLCRSAGTASRSDASRSPVRVRHGAKCFPHHPPLDG